MLIKYKDEVINLDQISVFKKHFSNFIKFYKDDEGFFEFGFESNEKRDKAFDRILSSVTWHRDVCDLD